MVGQQLRMDQRANAGGMSGWPASGYIALPPPTKD